MNRQASARLPATGIELPDHQTPIRPATTPLQGCTGGVIDTHFPTVRELLLAWYDANRRALPWRPCPGATPNPYHVWLSEAMLQQTRVDTVRPYFTRWLQRFPTLNALAAAPLDDVLKAWEGLGYYSRARNLHRAVQEVGERYGGEIPDDPDSFRALPGVGRYTAGAVMSIAFGREEPIVDGNVRRVFARWTDAADPKETRLWTMAEALVAGERPGILNQAVMELGALICTPRSPRCDVCPVRPYCAAHALGTQEQRPAPRRSGPVPREDHGTAVVEHDGRVLIARRPTSGRLGGMWEFPSTLRREDEEHGAAARRAVWERLGLQVRVIADLTTVDHAFTHVRVRYYAVRCSLLEATAATPGYADSAWCEPLELERYALPRAQRKIAAAAFPPAQPPGG